MSITTFLKAGVIIASFTPMITMAQPPGQGSHSHHPPPPPQEAFDACSNKSSGDSCSVNTPRGDYIAGICDTPPEIEALVCIPKNELDDSDSN